MKWLAAVVLPLLWSSVAIAEVPANRLVTLARGVNVVDVFSDRPIGEVVADVNNIQQAHLRHIRIFVQMKSVDRPEDMQRLDKTVQAAFALKLGVILCVVGKDDFIDDPKMIANYTSAWSHLAQHYRNSDPALLFPELVNEPALTDVSRWATIQEQLRQTVRDILPENTILLTGSPTSTSWALANLPPSSDPNVVYVFHVYAPMVFTHQGADWGDEGFWTIHGLRYPPDPMNARSVEQKAMAKLRPGLRQYSMAHDIIDRELGPAIVWAERHDAHLIVTEFGVFRQAPTESRNLWFRDVRTALERAGIGWTVWEYNAGFGIKPELSLTACTPLKDALSLCH